MVKASKTSALCGLYGISEDGWWRDIELAYSMLSAAIDGGLMVFQLREKRANERELLPLALRLRELCTRRGVLFIMNDRVHLAAQIGADGVHIGRDDDGIGFARKILGEDKIIGVSCYGELSHAISAECAGADYVAFGSCFASPSKPEAREIGVDIFSISRIKLSVPVCAIGGINVKNIAFLKNANMVAVISALWGKEPLQTLQNAKNLLREWSVKSEE